MNDIQTKHPPRRLELMALAELIGKQPKARKKLPIRHCGCGTQLRNNNGEKRCSLCKQAALEIRYAEADADVASRQVGEIILQRLQTGRRVAFSFF